MFRDSIVLSVASKQSNSCAEMSVVLLTNRKHSFEIYGIFLYTPKMRLMLFGADVTSYVRRVVRIEIVVQKRCFYRRI